MHYFDTSFLIPYFLDEAASSRVEHLLRQEPAGVPTISLWTRIEFSSALARQVRTRSITAEAANRIENLFDSLLADVFETVCPVADDFDLAKAYVRRYETGLRSGDALHLAIAGNRNAQAIYSLDQGLVKAGQLLGLPVRHGIRLA